MTKKELFLDFINTADDLTLAELYLGFTYDKCHSQISCNKWKNIKEQEFISTANYYNAFGAVEMFRDEVK